MSVVARTLLALSTAAVLALPATDSFTDRNASTLGSAWTAVNGAITDWIVTIGTGTATGYAGADYAGDYNNLDSYNADQYSQIAITKGTNGYEGVGVRLQSGPTGYFVHLESGTCTIQKWVAGTRSTVSGQTCSVSWTNGHTLYIEATGANPTSIVVKDNGSTIGTASDSDIDSGGSAGIIGYQDAGAESQNWQGGNTGSTPSVFPPAIINAPIRCCKGIR